MAHDDYQDERDLDALISPPEPQPPMSDEMQSFMDQFRAEQAKAEAEEEAREEAREKKSRSFTITDKAARGFDADEE